MSGSKSSPVGFVGGATGAGGLTVVLALRLGDVADRLYARVDLGDRVEALEHRRADRGAAAGRESVERLEELLALGRRRHDQLGESREHDEPHPGAFRLVLDERARGRLGHGEAVGGDVGRAHRSRDVEGQDDRRARVRDAQDHLRPGGGEREGRQGGEQHRHREMSLPPLPLGEHRAQQRDARVAHGLLPPSALCPPVHAEQDGDDEEREQRERPHERHLRSPAPARESRGRSRWRAGARPQRRAARSPRAASRRS